MIKLLQIFDQGHTENSTYTWSKEDAEKIRNAVKFADAASVWKD